MTSPVELSVRVNGATYTRTVEPRLLLSDFLRQELNLTGTHVGCEHGVCGACTILMDGEAVRSCLVFAVQVDGHELTTVEGLAAGDDALHPLQDAETNRPIQAGGVKYTIKDGILYDAKRLLADVERMVEEAKSGQRQ